MNNPNFGISQGVTSNVIPSNQVFFDQNTPTSVGVVFTPNTPAQTETLYISSTDSSTWIWNGADYITYTSTETTEFYITGTTTDAGSDKTSSISRTGGIIQGDSNSYISLSSSLLQQMSNIIPASQKLITAGTLSASFSFHEFIRMRGTIALPLYPNNLDNLGAYRWSSYIGNVLSEIKTIATQGHTATEGGTKQFFSTTPNDSVIKRTVMTLDQDGSVAFVIPFLNDNSLDQVVVRAGDGTMMYRDASSFSATINQANKIYVDSVNGVDSTGRGGISNPYLTLNYAQTDVPTSTGTFSCDTATNTLLTNISDVNYALLVEGQFTTGAGIPFNTKILSKDGGGVDAKQVTLTRPTTATASITATWVTTYDIMCLGSFVPTANIHRLGFYYDFETYNASVVIGNFTLFVFTANVLIPFGFKLGRTYGNHVNSSLHNTGVFSGVEAIIDYGNYYSIGNSHQLGNGSAQFTYSSDVTIEGEMLDARFGYVSHLGTMSGNFIWNGNAYGLLGGVRGFGTLSTNISGAITTPTTVLAVSTAGAICNIHGSIRGSVNIGALPYVGTYLQQISVYADVVGTTFAAGYAPNLTVTNLYGQITANLVTSGVVNVYSFVNGNITVNDLLAGTVTNLYAGCVGTITATSGTVVIYETLPSHGAFVTPLVIGASGSVIVNGIIKGNFTFTGAGKLTVNGTIFPSVVTNSPPPSIIANGGSVIINPSGVIRYDGIEVACLMTKTNGTLINNGRMVNSSKLFVNYSANNSASKDIIIQNSFTNGNGSNGGVGKGTGNIMWILPTSDNTDTSVTIFDGTNTVAISVVGAGKTGAVISAEIITLIKASILLFQCCEFLVNRVLFIGLQSISTTATSLVNATTGTWNPGGGLSFVPNDLVGGTENNNEKLNY